MTTSAYFLLAWPSWCRQSLPVILRPRCRDNCSNITHLQARTFPRLTHQLPLLPPPTRTHKQQPTKSPSFSSHPPLKTALSVMPTSYEVWLRGMQFAIAIVCRNDDRGGGTAESSQGLEGKARERERERACHQSKKSYFLRLYNMFFKIH